MVLNLAVFIVLNLTGEDDASGDSEDAEDDNDDDDDDDDEEGEDEEDETVDVEDANEEGTDNDQSLDEDEDDDDVVIEDNKGKSSQTAEEDPKEKERLQKVNILTFIYYNFFSCNWLCILHKRK